MKHVCYLILFSLLITLTAKGQSNLKNGLSFYQEKYNEATNSFKSIEKSSGDYGTAQYYLGRIAYDKKQYGDAVDYFKIATEKSPAFS